MSSSAPYKNVVAVIVTYNGSKWVHPCFGSLAASEYPISVIVVDNNSSDNTVALIEESYPKVRVIKELINLGFGGANNIGIKEGLRRNADYVFLLNQDAWIEKTTIGNLVMALERNKSYGIISPMHYTGTGSRLDRGFKLCISKSYSQKIVEEFQITPSDHVHQSEFINAAAWLVSRESLQRVGGFGNLFFQYGEDRDYVNRLNYNLLKVKIIELIKVNI